MAPHNPDRVKNAIDPEDLSEGFAWGELEREREDEEAKRADLRPEHELGQGPADQNAPEPSPSPVEADRESLRRALRDLESAKTRVERDAKNVYDETRAELVSEVLPVLDNLERTIQAVDGKCDPAMIEGVRMVEGQLERVLGRLGLERINAEGLQFDPQMHEAVAMVPVTDSMFDGMVVKQMEPGFKFGDRLLRAAKVVVGKLQH
ncbi:MAG: GrpE protein [Myxococcales bacterium]|nr:GrpE protein [Myxococcales bacterium]